MKRVTTLLLAAIMMIGTAGIAGAAVEFKASGHMHLNFSVIDNDADNTNFNKDVGQDNFYAAQRFRPKLTMKADGVTAVFEAQQHQALWGSDWPVGGNPDTDIRIRQAYIDFKLPSTPVSLKVGYQQLNLPSIWGHPVFEARVGAVTANIPFNDQIALTAFWARPADKLEGEREYDDGVTTPLPSISVTAAPQHNSTDMFGAMLPLDFGTVKVTPYFVYFRVGMIGARWDTALANAVGGSWNDTLIVGGANFEIMPMDALSVKVDAIVTNHKSDAPGSFNAIEAKTGFMIAAAADYEMPWGTPGLFAWYASGADDDGEGGLMSVQTDGFGPSSWGFSGANTFQFDSQINGSGIGTWAIGLQIADMSFVDSLKHTVRVLYAQGTNDKDLARDDALGATGEIYGDVIWTEKDSFIEVNLDSTWSIYENLAAVVELGGLIPDLGSNTKRDAAGNTVWEDDFAWKAQLTLRFSF